MVLRVRYLIQNMTALLHSNHVLIFALILFVRILCRTRKNYKNIFYTEGDYYLLFIINNVYLIIKKFNNLFNSGRLQDKDLSDSLLS